MRRLSAVALILVLSLSAYTAYGHHSFAVYFDSQKRVSVTGEVTRFAFRNPHGLIVLKVKKDDGSEEEWKAETNSPSILSRRGWTKDSLTIGETVTIEGWPARNNANLMRLLGVTHADGTPVGAALSEVEQQK